MLSIKTSSMALCKRFIDAMEISFPVYDKLTIGYISEERSHIHPRVLLINSPKSSLKYECAVFLQNFFTLKSRLILLKLSFCKCEKQHDFKFFKI